MEKKLYDWMDWPRIEAVVYGEEDRPRDVMAPRVTSDGVLIQGYFPGEKEVYVLTSGGKQYEMVCVDEDGYFAALLPGKKIPSYRFCPGSGENSLHAEDPYAFGTQITEKEAIRFGAGIWYDAWKKMGAHKMTVNGTEGVYFAVWAPNAMRVSVVGAFNGMDGRRHPMNRMDCGIFELFIPGLPGDVEYRYELKIKGGLTYLKSDPYGAGFRDHGSAAVADDGKTQAYPWKDTEWTAEEREKAQAKDSPLLICQIGFPAWCEENHVPKNYREAAAPLADYLEEFGFTHVEFAPLAEYPSDESEGFETCGYFAPTDRFGTQSEFCFLIDYLHRRKIGVIFDFVASYFASGNSTLAAFDGTCLFEHLDARRGVHPAFGTHIFNYGRPEVSGFLISALLCWAERYHADGFKITDVATMLYQDYGRNDGEWVANLYGGSENLEAQEWIRHANSILHQKVPGILTIAEDMAGWNGITGDLKRDGLGFDYKWNHTWSEDFLSYMHMDSFFRGAHQDELTFSTVYAFSENFILGFGKDDIGGAKGTLLKQMAGDEPEIRRANWRLAMAYMVMHPGKKLLYGGGWSEEERAYAGALSAFYHAYPALYRKDLSSSGFEWISNLDHERNLLIFLRRTEKEEDTLLVVCNFSNVEYDEFRIGVPYAGKYKECFNSDAEAFGGGGVVNARTRISAPVEHDERKQSVKVRIPPLAVSVYRYEGTSGKRSTNRTAKEAAPAEGNSGRDLKKELETLAMQEDK